QVNSASRAISRAATSAAGRIGRFTSGKGSDLAGRKPSALRSAKTFARSACAVMLAPPPEPRPVGYPIGVRTPQSSTADSGILCAAIVRDRGGRADLAAAAEGHALPDLFPDRHPGHE